MCIRDRYQKDLEALLEKRSQENKDIMAMYQTIVDNSLMGLTIVQNEEFVFANKRTAEIFGYPLDEFLMFGSSGILNLIHPEDQEKLTALSVSRLNGDELLQNTRIRIYTRDKQLKQIETHIKAVQFKGKPALHQTFLDITNFYQT